MENKSQSNVMNNAILNNGMKNMMEEMRNPQIVRGLTNGALDHVLAVMR
jgi:hypothetical protein